MSLLAAEAHVLHLMVNAGGHLRLWLLHRDVLIAAATHSAGVATVVFLDGGVVPRILECTFVG